jgi:8-oxo-dGTP diphosphatase
MKKGEDFPGIAIVYACHDGQGNYLMSKRGQNCRDERGRWDIGGGALEFGDTVTHTLEKEIKEEYLTDVLDSEFLGFRDVHRENEGKETHWIGLDFKVLVDKAKAGNGEPHKFDEVNWFQLEALPESLHSQLPGFIEKYKNRL